MCPTGIQCDDCVLLMCDRSAVRSILRFNDEQDKVYELDSHMVRAPPRHRRIAPSPPPPPEYPSDTPLSAQAMASVEKKGGDSDQFAEFVQKNLKLYSLRTGTSLSTHGNLLTPRPPPSAGLTPGPQPPPILYGMSWQRTFVGGRTT